MQYRPDWTSDNKNHAGYRGYNGAPQTQAYHQTNGRPLPYDAQRQQQHQQRDIHPMVVVPQLQNQNVSHLHMQTHASTPHYSPAHQSQQQAATGVYQRHPSQQQQQWAAAPQQQQQYYPPTSTSQPQYSHVHEQPYPNFHQGNAAQTSQYYTAPSQQSYPQPVSFDPRNAYTSVVSARDSVPSSQSHSTQPTKRQTSTLSRILSSPDPLQMSPATHSLPPSQKSAQARSHHAPQQRNSQPQHRSAESHTVVQSTPQRVLARVEIPAYQAKVDRNQPEAERPQKRRKSNESSVLPVPVPVRDPAPPQKRIPKHDFKPSTVSSSPLTELTSSQLPPTPKPNVDYRALLLELADEYITAAYSMSMALAASGPDDECQNEYHSLLAMAMGCLESVLDNYRISDHRMEARVRLRLAALLIEETENNMEAEQVLTKGIALCERSRLSDLKYAMQHLVVRMTFKTSPKAALKATDKLVQEVEALQLHQWTYSFRFLRVALSLQLPASPDMNAALKNLAAISAQADTQHDISVQIVAAMYQALAHLKSGSVEAVELAQRSLAAARTHQLTPQMQRLPQMSALMDCLDVALCLAQSNFHNTDQKVKKIHENLEILSRQPGWHKDGTILVELTIPATDELENDTCGILRRSDDGRVAIAFQWITKGQIYALGYMLSGFSKPNRSTDIQAEEYFKGGLKLCQQPPDQTSKSLHQALQDLGRQESLRVAIQLQMVFTLCAQYHWSTAQEAIRALKHKVDQTKMQLGSDTKRMMSYLDAVCSQGLGNLPEAAVVYESSGLLFEQDHKMSADERDIRLLSTLNYVLLSRALGPEKSKKGEDLMATIEKHCQHHTNKAMRAALYIAKATSQNSNNAIMKTKQHLQVAIDAAKAASNNQLLCLVINIMTALLFTNIVGEQAEKSAHTSVSLANKARNPLWKAVANGMYDNIMDKCGKSAEAQKARNEAAKLMEGIPESLKMSMQEGAR